MNDQTKEFIGALLLLAALVLAQVSVITDIFYGGVFLLYGIYRLGQYRKARK